MLVSHYTFIHSVRDLLVIAKLLGDKQYITTVIDTKLNPVAFYLVDYNNNHCGWTAEWDTDLIYRSNLIEWLLQRLIDKRCTLDIIGKVDVVSYRVTNKDWWTIIRMPPYLFNYARHLPSWRIDE